MINTNGDNGILNDTTVYCFGVNGTTVIQSSIVAESSGYRIGESTETNPTVFIRDELSVLPD